MTGKRMGFCWDARVMGYYGTPPFDPAVAYPELTGLHRTGVEPANLIYGAVRQLLAEMGLDRAHQGTYLWNPFGEFVRPGANIVVKPNLVTDRHFLGEPHLYSSIIHGSVLRPLIDYLWLALKGNGKIIIADNPVEGADFNKIMKFTGIRYMLDQLIDRGYHGLQLVDLRPRILVEGQDGRFRYRDQSGDPLGYVAVDLGKNSLFAEFDGVEGTHYYTLADRTIDHIDPKFNGASQTDLFHNPSKHVYVVSKTVLNADLVLSVAKLKSHSKTGLSLCLKNMIGTVHEKYCMPHHRPGKPPLGDAFPDLPASYYVAARKSYARLRAPLRIHRLPGFIALRNWLQKNNILVGAHIEHGNWRGNDTIWRTVLDLNRIVAYADRQGNMRDTPQRTVIGIVDGIVSQQGEGPMAGNCVATSLLIGADNPVLADALATRIIGLDYMQFPSIAGAKQNMRWPLLGGFEVDLAFAEVPVRVEGFRLSKGWA